MHYTVILPDNNLNTIRAGIKFIKKLYPTLCKGAAIMAVKNIQRDLINFGYNTLTYFTADPEFIYWGAAPEIDDKIIVFNPDIIDIGDL